MAIDAGSEPVRQGGEPRRPHRPRHPRATRSATSTCRRRCAATSTTRTSPATRPRCCRPTPRRTPRSPTPSCTGSPRPRTTRWRSAAGCWRRCPAASAAQVRVEEYGWDRIGDHSFVRRGGAVRTCVVTVGRDEDARAVRRRRTWSCSTPPTRSSRVSSRTSSRPCPRPTTGSWPPRWSRSGGTPDDVDGSTGTRRTPRCWRTLLETFAGTYSRALQETLYAMGCAVLDDQQEIAEIRFSAPNKHHFLVDFSRLRRRRADQRRRGVHRRRPALRPDRGAGDARRRPARG